MWTLSFSCLSGYGTHSCSRSIPDGQLLMWRQSMGRPGRSLAVATKLEAPAAPDLSIDLHVRFNCPVAEYREYWNSGGLSLLHDCSDCANMDERHTYILLCIIFTVCVTCCLAHCDMVITLGLSHSLLAAVMPCDCNFSSICSKSVRQGLQTN